MKKLLLFTIAIVFMSCIQVQASDVNTVKATIVKHSIEMGVDPAIALSIAKTESGFRHETKSANGAVGVFQLMPSTAKRMGLNAYSLNDNIRGGIMYYKAMYKMFGSVELALAAYNAGPGNVKRYNNKVPPYAETRRFVARIMADYQKYKTTDYVTTSKPQPKATNVTATPAKKPEETTKVEVKQVAAPMPKDTKPETCSI